MSPTLDLRNATSAKTSWATALGCSSEHSRIPAWAALGYQSHNCMRLSGSDRPSSYNLFNKFKEKGEGNRYLHVTLSLMKQFLSKT